MILDFDFSEFPFYIIEGIVSLHKKYKTNLGFLIFLRQKRFCDLIIRYNALCLCLFLQLEKYCFYRIYFTYVCLNKTIINIAPISICKVIFSFRTVINIFIYLYSLMYFASLLFRPLHIVLIYILICSDL